MSGDKLSNYQIGKYLGSGRFGTVFLARTACKPHFVVGLKVLEKEQVALYKMERRVQKEIEIMCHTNSHPNVLKFLLQDLEHFNDDRAATYIYQFSDGMNYLHERDVIHRDIKPENLLLGLFGEVKIADFGWSAHYTGRPRKTYCGTPEYLAPEIVESTGHSKEVDLWCAGILLFEMLTGYTPFHNSDNEQQRNRIRALDYSFPAHMDRGARNIIQNLLQLEKKRMNWRQIMEHEWTHNFRKVDPPYFVEHPTPEKKYMEIEYFETFKKDYRSDKMKENQKTIRMGPRLDVIEE
ncbi:hypothetical protein SNEBB_009915 [Seison nebaliae]|nr:hypothetical protein SNEBB_009915 [Seison nebaliae]